MGYVGGVNGVFRTIWQRKTAEGAATHLNGIVENFHLQSYAITGLTSSQMAVQS